MKVVGGVPGSPLADLEPQEADRVPTELPNGPLKKRFECLLLVGVARFQQPQALKH